MMSCYDNNFGKQELDQLMALKVRKLGKANFYKRMYFRLFQNMRYFTGKVANRVRLMFLRKSVDSVAQRVQLLEEINTAREILQRRLKDLEP
jgi:hypothetical protein